MDVGLGLLEKMKGKPERTAAPNSRKGADGFHGISQKGRRICLLVGHLLADLNELNHKLEGAVRRDSAGSAVSVCKVIGQV